MNQRTDRIAASGNREPRVGIFWLLGNGSLLVDSTPLAEAEPYGECLTHPRSHIDQWAEFQRNAIVPRDTEYEEMPRGRVVYDATTEAVYDLWRSLHFAQQGNNTETHVGDEPCGKPDGNVLRSTLSMFTMSSSLNCKLGCR